MISPVLSHIIGFFVGLITLMFNSPGYTKILFSISFHVINLLSKNQMLLFKQQIQPFVQNSPFTSALFVV